MDYLKFLYEKNPTISLASVDKDGMPVSVVIDITYGDETGLYFLTAKGKELYERLEENKNISFSTFFGGEKSLDKKAISFRGEVENLRKEKLDIILENNQYIKDIYKSKGSIESLCVFKIFKGKGEFFDLSVNPIYRERFSLGEEIKPGGYFITKNCVKCGACVDICPTGCIKNGKDFNIINENNCLHCGSCYETCPFGAIIKRGK